MFGNFAGMNFDRMNLTSEAIDKLLEDPKTTVEDLLKEEELLQEFRSQNEKLIDYFDKDKIKHLLDYIIKEQEDEQNKGYKFPFLCSQIFGLEIDKIMKYFFITNKQMQEEQEKEKKEKEEKKDDDNKNENKNAEEDKKEEKSEEAKKEENKEEKENNDGEKKDSDVKEGEKKEEVKEDNKEETKKNEPPKEEVKKEETQEKIDENEKKESKVKKEETETKKEGEEKKEEEKKEEEKKEEEKKEEGPKKEEGEKKEEEKKEEEKKEEGQKKEEGEKKEEEENKGEEGDENEEEKSEPESTENKIELLDYFFSFLPKEEDKKLNYVLCGYFSSLIVNLLSLNPLVFLKYIYKERSDVLDRMVTHCYRKSISDTLSKLLHFENYLQNDPLDDETKQEMNNTRSMLFSDIFDKIKIDMDNEDLTSIYYFITGLFDPLNIHEEKEIFKGITENKRIMRFLIYRPFHDLDLINGNAENWEIIVNRRRNFCVIIDIILFFLVNIKKLKLDIPTNTSDSKFTINHTRLSEEIFNELGNLIKNNFNKRNNEEKTILQSFNELQLKPLGEYKIKIVDLLSHLVPYFKNISKFFDEILIENEFFKNAFDYLYEYEWNNIYQDALLSLLKTLLNEANDHQLIQDHIFNTLKIYEIIKKYTNKEDKFKLSGEISTPIDHGYYSFFISLSYKINTVVGGTPIIINNNLSRQGSFTFVVKVPEEGDKKGALNMLYGGFDDMENNENEQEKEKEEKKCNYDSMKSYITDDWRDYFGLNIEDVIKQYENRNWPEVEMKNGVDLPFERASDQENKENEDDEGMNNRDKNIFGEDEDEEGNNNEDRDGRRGVVDGGREAGNFFEEDNTGKENEGEPFKNNDINVEAFEFDDNKEEIQENKQEELKDKKVDDTKDEEKDKKEEINKDEIKPEEVKPEENKKEEEKSEEDKKSEDKKEEIKEEEKKEEKIEEPQKEEKKEEKKEEINKEIKEGEKEIKKEEDNKAEQKEEVKKEEEKKETQENKEEEKK